MIDSAGALGDIPGVPKRAVSGTGLANKQRASEKTAAGGGDAVRIGRLDTGRFRPESGSGEKFHRCSPFAVGFLQDARGKSRANKRTVTRKGTRATRERAARMERAAR